MRLAFALGKAEVIESTVLVDMGDIDLCPASGEFTGDPSEDTEGADGSSVETGIDAKKSAPPWFTGDDGVCTLPTRFLLLDSSALGDCSLLDRLSSVCVRGRFAPSLSFI